MLPKLEFSERRPSRSLSVSRLPITGSNNGRPYIIWISPIWMAPISRVICRRIAKWIASTTAPIAEADFRQIPFYCRCIYCFLGLCPKWLKASMRCMGWISTLLNKIVIIGLIGWVKLAAVRACKCNRIGCASKSRALLKNKLDFFFGKYQRSRIYHCTSCSSQHLELKTIGLCNMWFSRRTPQRSALIKFVSACVTWSGNETRLQSHVTFSQF